MTPGSTTNSASPEKTEPSRLTTSTWIVFAMLFERLRLLGGFLDAADHVERLLGKIIVLAINDRLEAANGVLESDILALLPREGFGDVERLREEALDLARAGNHQLVVGRKLVHAQDRDDVPEFLVALQRLLDATSHSVVLLADDVRVQLPRGRIERVDCGVDAK